MGPHETEKLYGKRDTVIGTKHQRTEWEKIHTDVLEWWVTPQQHTRPGQFYVEEVSLGGRDKVVAERKEGEKRERGRKRERERKR
jgi:hypothetical protein